MGYKEVCPYFQNKKSLEDAILEIKKNSRRYAKRQITWFKKYDNSFIISSDTAAEEILSML